MAPMAIGATGGGFMYLIYQSTVSPQWSQGSYDKTTNLEYVWGRLPGVQHREI